MPQQNRSNLDQLMEAYEHDPGGTIAIIMQSAVGAMDGGGQGGEQNLRGFPLAGPPPGGEGPAIGALPLPSPEGAGSGRFTPQQMRAGTADINRLSEFGVPPKMPPPPPDAQPQPFDRGQGPGVEVSRPNAFETPQQPGTQRRNRDVFLNKEEDLDKLPPYLRQFVGGR